MLVLSRKLNESIHIGDGVVVTITEIRGNRVRLAISAPQDVPIRRAEVQPRVETATAPANRPLPDPVTLASSAT